MRTIKSIMDEHRGTGPGFDFLRFALASAIILYDARFLTHPGPFVHFISPAEMPSTGTPFWNGPIRPFLIALVPMFFALSGFLVTGSAIRLRKVSTFLAYRALRIFPALMVEVALSAFVLGAIFTTLPLQTYFTHPEFVRYLGNMFGMISFLLPGVFTENPRTDIVNFKLWTLPAEFNCYFLMAIMMISGIAYRRAFLLAVVAVATVVFIALNSVGDFGSTPGAVSIYTLTYYFFVGVLFYEWREKIPFSAPYLAVSAALSYVLLISPHTLFLAPVFLTYFTVGIGMLKIPRIPFLSSGDYSYGMYLYGFPISQAICAVYPMLIHRSWVYTAVAYLASLLFAVFSWHAIEKHALKLKLRLPQRLFPVPPRASPAVVPAE